VLFAKARLTDPWNLKEILIQFYISETMLISQAVLFISPAVRMGSAPPPTSSFELPYYSSNLLLIHCAHEEQIIPFLFSTPFYFPDDCYNVVSSSCLCL